MIPFWGVKLTQLWFCKYLLFLHIIADNYFVFLHSGFFYFEIKLKWSNMYCPRQRRGEIITFWKCRMHVLLWIETCCMIRLKMCDNSSYQLHFRRLAFSYPSCFSKWTQEGTALVQSPTVFAFSMCQTKVSLSLL